MRIIINFFTVTYFVLGNISLANTAIKTVLVQQITIDKNLALDARVEAINKTTLAAQTSGQVTEIFFDAGDIVTSGSVLLKLKDESQQANFKSAQALLKANKAELTDARNSLKRIKEIFYKKLSSQKDLDQAKARFNIAKANTDSANAQLKSAKEELNYTIIKAPYAGIVLERFVNLGEVVSPGTPLFSGTSLNQLRIVSQIPQQDIEQVRHFAKVTVDLPQGNTLTQQQDALKFYAYASPQTATFKVRIALPEKTKNLYPGMYLKAYFKTGTRTSLVVPNSAVVRRSELRAVYVQDKQGKLHLRQIRTAAHINNEFTEILAGLSVDEIIVTDPLSAIKMLNNATTEVKE